MDFDELLPQAISAWEKVMKHRVSHIHLAFDRYCSTFQVSQSPERSIYILQLVYIYIIPRMLIQFLYDDALELGS